MYVQEKMNYGVQNRHIHDLLQEKHDGEGYTLLWYEPHNIDRDTMYTNMIVKKVMGDAFFSWADAKHHRNSFGKTQHCNGHRCTFEHIQTKTNTNTKDAFFNNPILYSFENIAFTNLWLVIDNPQNVTLCDLVDTIEFESGGQRYQRYGTSDIELEINVLAHIFKVDGIAYQPGKIRVPLVVPYNVFFFNNTYHDHGARIRVLKQGGNVPNVNVYANVCDVRIFPELSHTTNLTHKCSFVFYRTQYTGPETISTTKPHVRLHFNHPTYALYIMNVSKERVSSIKLFLDNHTNTRPIVTYEYPLNDIEWHENHAIVWFNRHFLTLEMLNTHVNFSCCHTPYLTMENTYSDLKPNPIEIVAVSFDMLRHGGGLTGMRYMG
jgi:hypothetical protein